MKTIAGLLLALAAVGWWLPPVAVKRLPQTDDSVAITLPAKRQPLLAEQHTAEPALAPSGAAHEASEAEETLDPAAIESLRNGRLQGDARAPKLSPTIVRTAPTAAELQHHDAYLAYEQRQDKQLKRAYVEAAKVKVRELQNWIEKGRQHGISDEQIAQAQRKLEGIEAMAAELKQQHPDLLNDEFRPQQTPWL
ncbi:hypothetical protein GCM10011297_20530 [Bacterioplanes sanyensis]|uniref:hypothetical protein n=1 Tax=Bacterioplanes sanyensis TaxID=1249553 RepID=UPI001672DA97|nr:hypothetical protein [Bacterioplanes sanyensis]GGY47604.1 hypothetical protein GCM10011297_20530 [Bacterioplanes sanyensis]